MSYSINKGVLIDVCVLMLHLECMCIVFSYSRSDALCCPIFSHTTYYPCILPLQVPLVSTFKHVVSDDAETREHVHVTLLTSMPLSPTFLYSPLLYSTLLPHL